MKYRVLKQCTLTIEKDSIVELDPNQARLAEGLVSPLEEVQEKKKTKKKGE